MSLVASFHRTCVIDGLLDTLCDDVTRYLYMPRVRDHDIVRTVVQHMNDVLFVEQDGFAYTDSYGEGENRYRVLTIAIPRCRLWCWAAHRSDRCAGTTRR